MPCMAATTLFLVWLFRVVQATQGPHARVAWPDSINVSSNSTGAAVASAGNLPSQKELLSESPSIAASPDTTMGNAASMLLSVQHGSRAAANSVVAPQSHGQGHHVARRSSQKPEQSIAVDKTPSDTVESYSTATPRSLAETITYISSMLLREGGGGVGNAIMVGILIVLVVTTMAAFAYVEMPEESAPRNYGPQRTKRSVPPASRPDQPRYSREGRSPMPTLQEQSPHDAEREAQFMEVFAQREQQASARTSEPLQREQLGSMASMAQSSPKMSILPVMRPRTPSRGATPMGSPHGNSPRSTVTSAVGPLPPAVAALPHLCPTLVMPNNEALFAISFAKLMEGTGPLSVMGLSGHALLRMTVENDGAGKVIRFLMPPARSPTLASIRSTSQHGVPCDVFNGQGVKYGSIVSTGSRFNLLIGPNQENMVWIAFNGDNGSLNLHTTADGNVIASSSRADANDFNGEEHMEVYVHPGVDGVMVLCCVLAVVFPWAKR